MMRLAVRSAPETRFVSWGTPPHDIAWPQGLNRVEIPKYHVKTLRLSFWRHICDQQCLR